MEFLYELGTKVNQVLDIFLVLAVIIIFLGVLCDSEVLKVLGITWCALCLMLFASVADMQNTEEAAIEDQAISYIEDGCDVYVNGVQADATKIGDISHYEVELDTEDDSVLLFTK